MTNILMTRKNPQHLKQLNDRIYHNNFGIGKITILNDEVCEIIFVKNNLKQKFLPDNYKIGEDTFRYMFFDMHNFNFEINEEVFYENSIVRIVKFLENGGVEIFSTISNQTIEIEIKNLWKIEGLKEKELRLKEINNRNIISEQAKKDKIEREQKQQEERNYLIENCGYKECEQVHDGKKCGNLHAPEFHMCHKCYIVSRGEKWYRNSYK